MGERGTVGGEQSLMDRSSATTSAFYSLPSALYFWPLAKNRGECASFEHESQLVSEYVAEALELRNLEILL
jgi:hypothetical protein